MKNTIVLITNLHMYLIYKFYLNNFPKRKVNGKTKTKYKLVYTENITKYNCN